MSMPHESCNFKDGDLISMSLCNWGKESGGDLYR